MSLKLTILGCHSATPRVNANPTSQFLQIKNHHFLIDCGEGTQVQLRKNKIKFSKIDHIFISHLHGDHMYGLIGLISTYRLLNREKELHVYGPKGLKEIITLQLKLSDSWTHYKLLFHELTSKKSELIFESETVEVYTIPLEHRIYTNGFLFKEKLGERQLDMNAVLNEPEIQVCDYQNLKNGRNFAKEDGTLIPNDSLTKDPKPALSYAYCSDTKYNEGIVPIIMNVDCLYHEATFLKDRELLAEKTKHATAEQAALIAAKAHVGQLILGHFSGRYKSKKPFLKEAREHFENSILAVEGETFEIESSIST